MIVTDYNHKVERLYRGPIHLIPDRNSNYDLDSDNCYGLVPEQDSANEIRHNYYMKGVFIDPFPEPHQRGLVGFDLRVGNIIAKNDRVIDDVTEKDLFNMKHTLLESGQEYIFEPNADGDNVYYVTSFEKIRIASNLEMLIDSKSTTGRIGCLSHLAGKTSQQELITIIQPYTFPIKIRSGISSLSQAIFRYINSPHLTTQEILENNQITFFGNSSLQELLTTQGISMKFDTTIAYKSKPFNSDMAPIDVDAKNLDWKEYFTLIEGDSYIDTDKKTLYLLGSEGIIELRAVCGLLSRERGVLTGTGAWSHLAGIIQPFWKGGITMEFYSHEKRRIRKGSAAGYVIFDKIEGDVKQKQEGSYHNQKPPQPPKMFIT